MCNMTNCNFDAINWNRVMIYELINEHIFLSQNALNKNQSWCGQLKHDKVLEDPFLSLCDSLEITPT